jgi:hypothetical protein
MNFEPLWCFILICGELWRIVLEYASFNYIVACFGASPSGEADKQAVVKNELNSSVNRGIYMPTWCFNSSVTNEFMGHVALPQAT